MFRTVTLFALLSVMHAQQTTAPSGRPPAVIGGFGIPARALGTGGGCQFAGPLLRIPSKAAGEEGIVVRVSPPVRPRYPDGAPIAVHLNPPGTGGVEGSPACLSEAGFIDVAGLCPGLSSKAQPDGKAWKSGGTASLDYRMCSEASADVLAFATGRLHSTDMKSIQDYVAGMTALTGNAGVIGYSIGGNIAVDAIARFGGRFPDLKWYASWESPFAQAGFTLDEGSALKANRFYDPKTGEIDFTTLRYLSDAPVRYFPIAIVPAQARALKGALVLDGGPLGPEALYPLLATFHPGPALKVYYSPRVTRAAKERAVFGAEWPAHIAGPEEAGQFQAAAERELVAGVSPAVRRLPDLTVCVYESVQHHVGDDAGHSWSVAQVNAFLDAGAHWVRLNPDAHYIEWAMGRKPSKIVQNPAGKRFTTASIRDAVEPEDRDGGPTDKAGMVAAAAELADRTRSGNWSPTLDRVLISSGDSGNSGKK